MYEYKMLVARSDCCQKIQVQRPADTVSLLADLASTVRRLESKYELLRLPSCKFNSPLQLYYIQDYRVGWPPKLHADTRTPES